MAYTARTAKLLKAMKPGTRVHHDDHGPGTVTGPPEYFQVPVRFDSRQDRCFCYPDNLDILPPETLSLG